MPLLPQLDQVSLHGNLIGCKMPYPGSGAAGLLHPIFYNFGLSPFTVDHYYYFQTALREGAGHFTSLEVNLDLSCGRLITDRTHSKNSYNV